MLPKNNEIYRHFKGNLYKVITLAKHSETGEDMVVYQALYGDLAVYCRPLSMFMSKVDSEKYPDVAQKMRFERVDELISTVPVSLDEQIPQQVQESVKDEVKTETSASEEQDMAEEFETEGGTVDPLILEFLDAETIAEKKNILTALHHRITDEMINTLAVVMDVVVEDGELEDRYYQLKSCLLTKERYEIERKI